MDTKMKGLLTEARGALDGAASEIYGLRRRLEVAEAQVGVLDLIRALTMGAAPMRGAQVDPAWIATNAAVQISKAIKEAVETEAVAEAGKANTPVSRLDALSDAELANEIAWMGKQPYSTAGEASLTALREERSRRMAKKAGLVEPADVSMARELPDASEDKSL